MTNNYSSQNDESLAKNTNLEKPVSLYLSETESRINEEEIDAALEELLNIIHPKKNVKFRTIFAQM